jgi:hypothetical protein
VFFEVPLKLTLLVLTTSTAFALVPRSVSAQERWPYTLEVYVGHTRATSNNGDAYRGDTRGIMGGIIIGRRLHAADRAGPIIALGYGGHAASLTTESDCLLAPGGGCVPWFPNFGGPSLLSGWESRSTNLRFLAGPGFMQSDDGDAFGLVGRVDATLGSFSHLSAMATIDGLFVPSYQGDRFASVGIGIGLRVR